MGKIFAFYLLNIVIWFCTAKQIKWLVWILLNHGIKFLKWKFGFNSLICYWGLYFSYLYYRPILILSFLLTSNIKIIKIIYTEYKHTFYLLVIQKIPQWGSSVPSFLGCWGELTRESTGLGAFSLGMNWPISPISST